MDTYNEIQLEFVPSNLRKVIEWGAEPAKSPHSHQAIAMWCERFWNKYCEFDAPEEIEEVMPLLAEIETEWDIYIANYKEQHPHAVKSAPQLPPQYFESWAKRINA